MSSLRVALVTETYPPEVNGVAATLAELVTALRRREHEIRVVRPVQPATVRDVTPEAGAMLVRGCRLPRYPHLRMGLPCGRVLRRSWTAWRPDVVHIATEGPLGFSALRAATRLSLPVSSDFRTNFHAYSAHYGIGLLRAPILAYLRHFHNRARLTMVPTDALARELADAGIGNLAVVGRGVDTVRFSPARRDAALRRQWNADDDSVVVAYVGRLAAEKNLDLVAQCFDGIDESMPGARCLVVGDGPERARLAARCPQAVFAGARYGIDLAAHYASSDVVLFPSLTETFGNTTLEAMASGVPVVAFEHAAAATLIRPGIDGITVPSGERSAYVAAALALAQATDRAALGQRARQRVERLGWDSIAQSVETLWRGIVG